MDEQLFSSGVIESLRTVDAAAGRSNQENIQAQHHFTIALRPTSLLLANLQAFPHAAVSQGHGTPFGGHLDQGQFAMV